MSELDVTTEEDTEHTCSRGFTLTTLLGPDVWETNDEDDREWEKQAKLDDGKNDDDVDDLPEAGTFLVALSSGDLSMRAAEVLLEASWEADDVKEECVRRGLACVEMSTDELRDVDTQRFLVSTFLCDTEVVQAQLRKAGLGQVVPDTYPAAFGTLYHRRITKRVLSTLVEGELPLFVKPCGNSKRFDGTVVRSLAHLPSEVPGSTSVYVAEVVEFGAEHRLFVGGGRLYGTGLRLSGVEPGDEGTSLAAFAEEVVRLARGFMAVDVAWLARVGCYAVLEVNPPFALDDCGLPIGPYMQFCVDACEAIREVRYAEDALTCKPCGFSVESK